MISPVSFKGTYRIDSSENNNDYKVVWDVGDKLFKISDVREYVDFSNPNKTVATYVIDDKYDKTVESYMISRGINFKRFSKEELLSEESIKSRIIMDEYHSEPDYMLVEIDTEKFNKEYKEHGFSYVGDGEDVCFAERYKGVEEYLQSGQDINASIVYVKDEGAYPEISFQDGRHRYAYFRNIGMKSIPVVMNQESIAIARKYGLLAK